MILLLFFILLVLIAMYAYGYMFGDPYILRKVLNQKSENCFEVGRADKLFEERSVFVKTVGITKTDIVKEMRRLNC